MRRSVVGLFKVTFLLAIVVSSFATLAGESKEPKHNNFGNSFAGSCSDIYGVASAIYNVPPPSSKKNLSPASKSPSLSTSSTCSTKILRVPCRP